MRIVRRIAVVGLGLCLGCSASRSALREAPPGVLDDAESVGEWQGLVRPDRLVLLGVLLAIAGPRPGDCPSVAGEGPWLTIQGGCTDDAGDAWTGQARRFMDESRVRTRMRAFGRDDHRIDGRLEVRSEPEPSFAMDVVVREYERDRPSQWMAIDARGRQSAAGEWFGEGQVATDALGRIRVRGEGIVLDDDVCAHEPVRGRLELWSTRQRVRIDYDGATDCDREGTARWSLDGVDQGELLGVGGSLRCSSKPDDGAPTGAGTLLGLGMLGGRRRRRRTR